MAIKEDFFHFQDEVVDLIRLYKTFQALYKDQENLALLGRVDSGFFSDLSHWMKELYFLRVGRLTDPAETRGRSNLSARHIVQLLKNEGFDASKAERLAGEIETYRTKTSFARNRYIAHNDLDTFRAKRRLGEHNQADIDAFFKNLQLFVESVEEALGRGPSDYWLKAVDPRIELLLKQLRKGHNDG